MAIEESFFINDWQSWDKVCHVAVCKFWKQYELFPSILLANSITFDIVDLIAKRSRVCNWEDEPPPDGEYISIAGFQAGKYLLHFCVDNDLLNGCFMLVYDSEAKFAGGDNWPREFN